MSNNFLTHITAPTLGSATFATDLQEVFRNIDDNFKKIVSAPYLEGQEGLSIIAVDLPLVENGVLTKLGKTAAREIFSNPDIETLEDIDTLCPPVGGTPEHSASEYLVEHPNIKMFAKYNPDTGEIDNYICSSEYYLYLDMRVEDLGTLQNPSSQTTFIDYTCQLFGEYTTDAGWVFTKGIMLPTLYYNSDLGCFCWKINNAETGIRAQGVKGDDGRPPLAAVVKGAGRVASLDGLNVVRITVTDYSVLETSVDPVTGETVYQANWNPVTSSGLQNGDLVACIFTIVDPTYGTTYPDMVLGNLLISGTDSSQIYTITLPDANRFSSLWRSYLTFYAFRDIDYKSTDPSKSKAVFVPGSTPGVTHAMFQDDSGVEYTQTGGNWTAEDTLNEDNLVFKKVSESRLVGSGSMGDANKMTSADTSTDFLSTVKFIGYNSEVEGTSKSKVNGLPGVLLGTPVGTIVNWINMENVPEGWYPTGEVTTYTQPVFGMRYASIDATDYDVAVKNGDSFLKKLTFTDITEDGGLGNHDAKFYKIFSVISGTVPQLPMIIQTDQTTYESYMSIEKFNWNTFDLNEVSGGLAFYLTKLIS